MTAIDITAKIKIDFVLRAVVVIGLDNEEILVTIVLVLNIMVGIRFRDMVGAGTDIDILVL